MSGNVYLLWILILLFLASFVAGSEGSAVFPRVEGKALTGEEFQVPDSLAGDFNLILVAFLREQQEDVDTWIPRADSLESEQEGFTFYEFPVLPEMNAVSRWFIYQGMRSGIASEAARARTVTFHLNKDEFRENLGIESEDYISVFLVDSEGKVIWRTSGTWSQQKEDELREVLAR
jgi:hypothetical protein